jgi:hypothetical protein
MTDSRPRVLNSVGVVAAVRGVAQQWQGRAHGVNSNRDGAAAGLTSRCVLHKHIEDIRGSRRPPFEGAAC